MGCDGIVESDKGVSSGLGSEDLFFTVASLSLLRSATELADLANITLAPLPLSLPTATRARRISWVVGDLLVTILTLLWLQREK